MQVFNIPEDVINGVAAEIHSKTTTDYKIPVIGVPENLETPQVFEIMPFDQIDAASVLDGRNSWRACLVADIEPRFRRWDGKGSALAFVISRNLHRRHLTESQRAMVAARIATMRQGERTSSVVDCASSGGVSVI